MNERNSTPVLFSFRYNGKKTAIVMKLWTASITRDFYTKGPGKKSGEFTDIVIHEIDPLLSPEAEYLCRINIRGATKSGRAI